ncbi:immunity 8 family protein [Bartonella sp. HY406]|uniref:immunity 8 family protein n=1 Tax=Bartonella sp. HY406 TaxID=2979331 RepID=UPI0021CA3206|nr:immunity 8 family protein [Bartonella sp. HY406]UXN03190.1 immunity 8 family protein [Bartonella sp. HY406]
MPKKYTKLISKQIEIKGFHCSDIDNLEKWKPLDNCVFYSLDMYIGYRGEDGCDIYSVMIATREGIAQLKHNHLDHPYKIILIEKYSWQKVKDIIQNILDNAKQIISQIDAQLYLCQYFSWEYEGMINR